MKFYLVRFKDQSKVLFGAMCDVGGNEYAEYRAKLRGEEIEDILIISWDQAQKIGMKNQRDVFIMSEKDDPYEWISMQ